MKINSTTQFVVLFGLLFIIVFLKLGEHPIYEWDEARNGVSAIEMLNNQDWINPHYGGVPDDWNAKPPLTIWCIAGSFSIFGFNEFALRLPSAIAIIFAFLFIFKIIRLYKNENFAFYTLLILMSVNGLIGWHTGRTGDTDAMLVCFLMVGLYFFLQFYDFGKKNVLHWSALFWGVAFMTKGPAMGVLFPGLFLYILLSDGLKRVVYSKNVWLAFLLMIIFPVAWFLTVHYYGATFENNSAGDNTVERLILYDLWERFTENEEGWKKAFSIDFFFYSLDKLFNIWNYIFFGFLAMGSFLLTKNWKKWSLYLLDDQQKIILLALCLYFPLAIFLTLAAKSHSWYLAPIVPFVGIVTYFAICLLKKKYRFVLPIFIALLCFTIGRKLYDFYTPEAQLSIISENWELLSQKENIAILGIIEQDILLYNHFANQQIGYPKTQEELTKYKLVFANNSSLKTFDLIYFKKINENENYSIYELK